MGLDFFLELRDHACDIIFEGSDLAMELVGLERVSFHKPGLDFSVIIFALHLFVEHRLNELLHLCIGFDLHT